jgi:hypothetical protein
MYMIGSEQRLTQKPKMENQNQSPKAQLIERLKESNNVLVTVSRNPSVDQLSAAIGLTLMLNHLGKHATAVFSGEVPNTLEFLSPEETLERNTDSLRDFIISLDKAKADKLRYKVEDKMVKIFITPYRTSLSEADLVFGQGDFNVDVVVALGVHDKEELDEAITSHGRILHDATVATVNTVSDGQLGSINWVDSRASSLCEMVVPVCESLKAGALDAQMATAFLTGIVAETQRFSNEKTSSETMSISAKLMNAGANQQLVATKLEQAVEIPREAINPPVEQSAAGADDDVANDGSLNISHNAEPAPEESVPSDLPEIQPEHQEETEPENNEDSEEPDKTSRLILQPPTMGGKLTANTEPEGLDPSTDPLSTTQPNSPLLTHDRDGQEEPATPEPPAMELEDTPFALTQPPVEQPPEAPAAAEEPAAENPMPEPKSTDEASRSTPEPQPAVDEQTLSDLESAVDSPHVTDKPNESQQVDNTSSDADAALAAAHQAFDAAETDTTERPAAFNASGPMEIAHDESVAEATPAEPAVSSEPASVAIDPATGELSYPSNLVPPSTGLPSDPTGASVEDPTAPPPVPPPMAMPPLMPPVEPPADPNNLPPVNP